MLLSSSVFLLRDFICVFTVLQVCIFFHIIYKGLLQSVGHIHFERELCSCSPVARFLLLDHILFSLMTCYYLVALVVVD